MAARKDPAKAFRLDPSLEMFRPEIEGRTAVVTGGSSGIGSEIVKTLAALGAKVHFCGRNAEAGKGVEALFPEGGARFARVDVTKPKELERWIAGIPVIDYMVNDVADDKRVAWDKIDADAIERAFAVNLRSHFLAIHAAIPAVRKGAGKSIVIMGTSNWMRPEPDCILYNVTKSGIVGLTHALAREFGPEFIRVNTFTPGWIATPKQLRLNMDAAAKRMLKREQALPVILYPQDMMGPILFRLSRAAKAVTGQNLLGEGGKVMT